ncbi:hypothetical protein Kisp02_57200 [Kineosporia sp. NBRC 101731]|nr:hypothetical protein Kisp02_57200 [Kineosporia sp. NBRC 101731]
MAEGQVVADRVVQVVDGPVGVLGMQCSGTEHIGGRAETRHREGGHHRQPGVRGQLGGTAGHQVAVVHPLPGTDRVVQGEKPGAVVRQFFRGTQTRQRTGGQHPVAGSGRGHRQGGEVLSCRQEAMWNRQRTQRC